MLRQLGKVTHVLRGGPSLPWAHVEGMKAMLKQSCLDFLSVHNERAVLQQLSMDSTPGRLRHYFTVGDKRKRKTSAVAGRDLIVGQNNFSVLDASGKVVSRIVFREPMLVEGSKTSQ
eukprot:5827420-Amphidinium_carterae.1